MEKKLNVIMKITQMILGVMLLGAFILFLYEQIALPTENHFIEDSCKVLEAEWVRVLPGGSVKSMEVPGQCEAKCGEWVTVETILPEYQTDTCLCFRSMQQELKVFVGGKLRKEYSTLDTQLFGNTSTIAYMFVNIEEEDAGQPLRVEFMTESSYSGYLDTVYTGDKSEIWKYFFHVYGPSLLIAVFLLMLSFGVVIACLVGSFFYKREAELLYLGLVIMIASTWLIAESRLRQYILPNSTAAMHLGFYMIMLLPFPFSAYLNRIQKGRHQLAFLIVSVCVACNCVLTTVLQMLDIRDFYEIMGLSHVIIVATMIFFVLTITLDIRSGHIKEYKEVALGFLGLIIGGAFEIYLVYQNNAHLNGIALCLALVLVLFIACLKAVRDMLFIEKEKQAAIASSESKAQFLASMSHEIRTPINSIIGMNEMILRENQDPAIGEYARQIHSSSNLLLGLINDVLDFSKIEAGKLEIVENEYQVFNMLRTVVVGIRARAKRKNLELHLDIDRTLPAVLKGDEMRIQQILNNMLSNAVKYTEKGSITLVVKGMEDQKDKNKLILVLSVADTGIGIRKEDTEHLFDSFRRLEVKKNRAVEGTGLGLNITKRLVENMHGKIEVESEYGKGSCFTVYIPQEIADKTTIADYGLQENTDVSQYHNVMEGEESPQGQEVLYAPNAKVLVVDDTKSNLKVMQMLLKRSQVQLDLAESGEECLKITKNKKYDLILMDHMMPDPDGIETLHRIRKDKDNANKETNVIVLTANAIAGMEEMYLKEGFADYLSKPVEVQKLERVLGKYLKNETKDEKGAQT